MLRVHAQARLFHLAPAVNGTSSAPIVASAAPPGEAPANSLEPFFVQRSAPGSFVRKGLGLG
ncbi:hypothetical protein LPB72_14100 [Hydrogenophaga crassostreae]|uniref:Uncharacterized protein n=1 Tax=Hydrogenophaga crassostreae TaxID=1763535 RepID=A0ABX2U4M9_9BURK|nr:hypothetical protein LPB72_14100 [Hydrogenophaga crassostreae]